MRYFNLLLVLVVALLGPQSLQAAPDDTIIALDGSVAASYLVTVTPGSQVTVTPTTVYRPGPAPPPPPPPPVPMPPMPTTDAGKAVMAAAKAVAGDPNREQTAHALANLWREVATLFRNNPTSTPAVCLQALSTGNNALLGPQGLNVAAQWQPVRATFGTYWTAVAGQQPPGTAVDYAKLLEDCANGLDNSAPVATGAKIVIPQNIIDLIFAILKLILQLLNPTPTP